MPNGIAPGKWNALSQEYQDQDQRVRDYAKQKGHNDLQCLIQICVSETQARQSRPASAALASRSELTNCECANPPPTTSSSSPVSHPPDGHRARLGRCGSPRKDHRNHKQSTDRGRRKGYEHFLASQPMRG